jgi:NAD-dependent dihydropyrimidine dehydrogenase PreA subunit
MAERVRGYEIAIKPESCVGCLVCQMRCSLQYAGEFNPARSFISIQWPLEGIANDVRFTEGCNYCGICARFCSYGALTITGRRQAAAGGGA